MSKVWRTLTLSLLCALAPVCLAACEQRTRPASGVEVSSKSTTPTNTSAPAEKPLEVRSLPESAWRGVCFAHNWQKMGLSGYGTDASAEALDHLKSLGANWVSITPFGWMSSEKEAVIRGEYDRVMPGAGETKGRVERVIAQARARDIKVMLKPHIWIRGGAWRGSIDPRVDGKPAWDAWWESYRVFILYYAKVAAEQEVDSLVVGVELVSAVKANPEQFIRTIEAVREVYDGHLTYSANWDEEVSPSVWSALDAIGVQLYPPLSKEKNPSDEALDEALDKHLRWWTAQAERVDKPILLTEVGYKSTPTSVIEPFGWPENLPEKERVPDQQIQARAYAALFRAIPRHPRVQGVFIWKYFTDKDTDEEGPYGFSPRGKKAEEILSAAFQADEKGSVQEVE